MGYFACCIYFWINQAMTHLYGKQVSGADVQLLITKMDTNHDGLLLIVFIKSLHSTTIQVLNIWITSHYVEVTSSMFLVY